METRELPIVAGHLALDFANTVDDPDGAARHDHIATWAGLVQWSVRIGLLDDAARFGAASAATLRDAHALRTAINTTFGDPARAARHWPLLRAYATDALTHSDLVAEGDRYRPAWSMTQPAALLWPVAHAAAELLTAPELARVKQCAGCPWLFVDRSKNGSRRWCSMDDCGTHQKITRYVARRKAKRSG